MFKDRNYFKGFISLKVNCKIDIFEITSITPNIKHIKYYIFYCSILTPKYRIELKKIMI